MESRTPDRAPRMEPSSTPDAIDFVRFCHRRRSVGWPELYDEMCAVAGRGLYRGWGADELGSHGIGFSLFEMPRLAVLVQQVVAEDAERRKAATPSVRHVARRAENGDEGSHDARTGSQSASEPDDAVEVVVTDPSLAHATAGA